MIAISREERISQAKKHMVAMAKDYGKEIKMCINKTAEYTGRKKFIRSRRSVQSPDIIVEDTDTVSAVYKYSGKGRVCALNFASYRHPGGGFLSGSKAQEECLCHESILYNVLKEFQASYYDINQKHSNNCLYQDKALFSPDIVFTRDGKSVRADVITCAAPNFGASHATKEQNTEALDSRIKFVLDIAEERLADTLILGAFGCGVFKQNPKEVAVLFKKHLGNGYGFTNVIFAVPKSKDKNYDAFKGIFS